jgi:hypothetical protein
MLHPNYALLTMLFVSSIAIGQGAEQTTGRNDRTEVESISEDMAISENTIGEESQDNQADVDPLADRNGDGIESPKTMSGMSILGNEEAPKSLVIIPWKSSELGDTISLSDTLDERARPVDKEVFLRELSFYDIRAEK